MGQSLSLKELGLHLYFLKVTIINLACASRGEFSIHGLMLSTIFHVLGKCE